MTTPTPPNPELAALPNLFLFNPKHRAFVEGKKNSIADRRLGSSLGTLIILVVIVFFGGVDLIRWLDRSAFYTVLSTSGVTTDGTFTRRWEYMDEYTYYYVAYEFTVNDQHYASEQQVNHETYAAAETGSAARVIYAAGNPRQSWLSSDFQRPSLPGLFLLGVGIILLVVRQRVTDYRKASQLSIGTLLKGEVTTWNSRKLDDGETVLFESQLAYVFHTPAGAECASKDTRQLSVGEHKRLMPPQPGTPIAVLYVDDTLYEVL